MRMASFTTPMWRSTGTARPRLVQLLLSNDYLPASHYHFAVSPAHFSTDRRVFSPAPTQPRTTTKKHRKEGCGN
jgi:hypothetical protein